MDPKENLRRIEMFLRATARLGSMGYWDYNMTTEQTWWSDEMYDLFGRDPSHGPPGFADLASLFQQTESALRSLGLKKLEGGDQVVTVFQARLPNGDRRWYRLFVDAGRGFQGKDIRLFGIVQDITEQRHVELQLEKHRARLKLCREEFQQKKLELRNIIHRCYESPQVAAREHSSQEESRYLPERLLVLTPRELEICLCVHRGLSSKEIASKIGITLRSVETHRRNIRRKLRIGRKNLTVHLLTLLGR